MGISKKYAYRDTWMRYADLQADSCAIADGNICRTTPVGKKRHKTAPAMGIYRV
jgi:hypothetical protein